MAIPKTEKSNRDRYSERLKEKYPDKEFSDDEAIFGQINDDYDNYDQEIARYREEQQSISDLFATNPRTAAFFTDWRNGEDPLIGLIRKFGDEFRDALEDPANIEKLAQANKEYAEKIAKEKEFEELYQKNIQETLSTLDQTQTELELTDDEIDETMDFLVNIVREGILGKFSKDTILMAMKAINHDNDVEIADREGEVRGRNSKIEEKLRKSGRSDGTANLSSRNAGANQHPRDMPDLGALSRYDNVQDIWERGGERRRSIK